MEYEYERKSFSKCHIISPSRMYTMLHFRNRSFFSSGFFSPLFFFGPLARIGRSKRSVNLFLPWSVPYIFQVTKSFLTRIGTNRLHFGISVLVVWSLPSPYVVKRSNEREFAERENRERRANQKLIHSPSKLEGPLFGWSDRFNLRSREIEMEGWAFG